VRLETPWNSLQVSTTLLRLCRWLPLLGSVGMQSRGCGSMTSVARLQRQCFQVLGRGFAPSTSGITRKKACSCTCCTHMCAYIFNVTLYHSVLYYGIDLFSCIVVFSCCNMCVCVHSGTAILCARTCESLTSPRQPP